MAPKQDEMKLDEAKALVDADAKAKAKASAKDAEKAKADAEAAEMAALTPVQRLQKDWPNKHRVLAPYITELGKVRGGLNIQEGKEAVRILKDYGFKV